MDEFIERVAARERVLAMQDLSWMLDRWRLDVGLVEVVPPDDGPIYRTLRHKRGIDGRVVGIEATRSTERDPSVRFVPTEAGMGVLVRDVSP